MGNLSVRERLEYASALSPKHEELRGSLELYKKILQIQQEIDDDPTKGAKQNGADQSVIAGLQETCLQEKKPLIYCVDPSIFNYSILLSTSKQVLRVLIKERPTNKGLENLLNLIESGKTDLSEFVDATLREDASAIRKHAEKLHLEPALLLYVISVLIQPFLEHVARKIDTSFSDNWWQTFCPVCGRLPIVARIRRRKRYLVCTFCGAEYLSDHFVCIHCGNSDPYTLKYMVASEKPGFQISFCTKCKHYVKVIDEDNVREPIPRGLEDVFTLDLDLVAKHTGLKRD